MEVITVLALNNLFLTAVLLILLALNAFAAPPKESPTEDLEKIKNQITGDLND